MDFHKKYEKYDKNFKLWAVLFFVSLAVSIVLTVVMFVLSLPFWIFTVVALANLAVNSTRRGWSRSVIDSGTADYFSDIDEGRIDFPIIKISVGQNGFVYNDGGVLYDDIFWVYKHTQSYSVYFIPVFKQSQLMIAQKNGNIFSIHIGDSKKWEDEISNFIQFLMSRNDSIRVGFVPEHQRAFSELKKELRMEAKRRKMEMKNIK